MYNNLLIKTYKTYYLKQKKILKKHSHKRLKGDKIYVEAAGYSSNKTFTMFCCHIHCK